MSFQFEYLKLRAILLGNSQVGKTTIIGQFLYDNFNEMHYPTVGIDFFMKHLTVAGQALRLQIWDTAGEERFRSLAPSFLKCSHIAILVYDITDVSSFNDISYWSDMVRAENGSDVVVMLVGNKIDLSENRQVSTEEGKRKAIEIQANFVEASAKVGANIKHIFTKGVEAAVNSKRAENKVFETSIQLSPSWKEPELKSCPNCC